MKILVISLLRLGDIIMQEQLFSAVRKKFPDAKIDVLINDQFLSVKDILNTVDQWIGFPRNALQEMLTKNPSQHMQAFDKLRGEIDRLNQEKYDIIFNFTHNLLSARLMDQLVCPDKRGLQFHNGIKVPSQNGWQQYMNNQFADVRGSKYHYLEVLAGSMGLELPGKVYASLRSSRRILVQLFTSDQKKNWEMDSFKQLIANLEEQFSDFQVKALCSPAELPVAKRYFTDDKILSPSLPDLQKLLSDTDLLISGDTSIQHLAALQSCRVLALFMGSADAIKSSAWQLGGYNLEAQADCYPCEHSKPCHQATHICGKSIKVDKVLNFAKLLLRDNEMEKLHGRSEYKPAQGLNL